MNQAIVAHDPLRVLRHPVVVLEGHAASGQLVDRRLDVVDGEVEDREAGRLVVRLG
nr:hypothetical protein [Patulibacter medicamentivorans]